MMALLLPFWCLLFAPTAQAEILYFERPQILDAIRQVESSGMANPPDGDDGRAIGIGLLGRPRSS